MEYLIRLPRVFERLRNKVRGMPGPESDTRAEKSLPLSLAPQMAVFACAPEAILVLDEEGKVVTLNPAAERLFGYRCGDASEFDVARLLSLGGDPSARALDRLTALASSKTEQEIAGWQRDGTVIPLEAIAAEIPGVCKAFAVFLRDLRERRRSDQAKGDFVATVSHELRTPLTSIAGSLGLLASGAGGALPGPALRLIRIAHANSQRLAHLVNDLLDIEKIASGALRFDIRTIPVKPLIQQAIEHTRPFADGFNVTVQFDPDSPDGVADADPDRLSQVVTNLLSNAIKFSPPGGEVDVSIALREADVRICVRDHGEGIPEDFRDRVFEKFAQADRGDRRHKGGSGLGLSIVHQIMLRMNGDVGFDLPPDGGTIFHVDLPQGKNVQGVIAARAADAVPELTEVDGRAA
jgi:PAS domain S-box-containing protein